MEFDINHSCCFSGHRDISQSEIERITQCLSEKIKILVNNEIRCFYVGGAKGFDMITTVLLVNMKIIMPEIYIILALPYREHEKTWDYNIKKTFDRLLKRVDEVYYVSDEYSPLCMKLRNQYMVDRSKYCICYLSSARSTGGTFNTVKYANKLGRVIVNLGL